MEKRKQVHFLFIGQELKDYEEKITVIKQANIIHGHKQVFLAGLNKLYEQAKQFIDSE